MRHDERFALMAMPVSEIGRALACSSDKDQSALLNSLAEELKLVCRDTELSGMQICYFAKHLNRHGRQLVRSLAEFIDLDDENKKGIE